MRVEVREHRRWNTRDLRQLRKRDRRAARSRPREALGERLVVRADVSLDRRCGVRFHVAHATVTVQIEVYQRRAADVLTVVDEILRDAVQVRAARDGVLKLSSGLDAERADEVVAARGRLQILLFGVHLLDVGVRVFDQAVDVVSTALRADFEWAAEAERTFGAVVRAEDRLPESLHALQVAADFRTARFRRDVGVTADLAQAKDRRWRTLHHFDGVHARQHRACVALHVETFHAAVVRVRLNGAHVDAALQTVARCRVHAGHDLGEIFHRVDAHERQLLFADERDSARRFHERLGETERRCAGRVRY